MPDTGVKQVVTEIAKLIDQFFDVQVMVQKSDFSPGSQTKDHKEEIEADLMPHKDMILSKLASLNRQSLESLVAILEEKTAVYTEKSDNHQIGDLIRALKVEVGKLL